MHRARKIHPCTPASLQIKHRSLRTKITIFLHKNPFCYPMSSHGFSLHFTCSQHLGYLILVHIIHIDLRYTIPNLFHNVIKFKFPYLLQFYANILNIPKSPRFSLPIPFSMANNYHNTSSKFPSQDNHAHFVKIGHT